MTSFYAPDAVVISHGIGRFEGTAAIRGFFQDWLSAYEDIVMEFEKAITGRRRLQPETNTGTTVRSNAGYARATQAA